MKIDTVEVTNLKGVTATFKLGTHNLIEGPNGAGKTALLDGLELACLGHHTTLGKAARKIGLLASGNLMQSKVTFEDGKINQFDWAKKGGIQALIEKDIPETLLSYASFRKMSAAQRTSHMMGLIDIPTHDPEDLKKRILDALQEKKITMAAGTEINDEFQAVWDDAEQHMVKILDEVVDHFKEQAKAKKEVARQAEAIITSNLELEPVPEVTDEQLDVLKQRIAANDEVERLAQAYRSLDHANEEIAAVEQEITETEGDLEIPVQEINSQIDLIQKSIQAHQQNGGQADGAVKAIQIQIQSLKDELESIDGAKTCPCCKSRAKTWKANATARIQERMKDLTAKASEHADLMTKAQSEIESLTMRKGELSAQRDSQQGVEREIVQLKTKLAGHSSTRDALLKQIGERGRPDGSSDMAEVRQELDELTRGRNEWLRYQARVSSSQESEVDIAHVQAVAQGYGVAARAIESYKAEVIDTAMTNLVGQGSGITRAVWGESLRFEAGDFYLGQVHIEALSGSEGLLLQSVLQLLLTKSPCRLLILDELGVFTDSSRQKLYTALAESALVEQFIGLQATDQPTEHPSSWTVHQVQA